MVLLARYRWNEPFTRENYELHQRPISAIAGVTNIGDSANWCGHHFAQSNWYAFGRMTWNPSLSSEQVADEWIKQTFTNLPEFLNPVKEMMLKSREDNVHYEMPLGLHHTFLGPSHYGPGPWEGAMQQCFISSNMLICLFLMIVRHLSTRLKSFRIIA